MADATRQAYGKKALTNATKELGDAGHGSRHNDLNKAAYKMGQLIPGGALECDEVLAALKGAAVRNGYLGEVGERQVLKTIHDGLTAGTKDAKTDWKEPPSREPKRPRTSKPGPPAKDNPAPEPQAVVGEEPYPDQDEVRRLWERCRRVGADNDARQWLQHKRRNIDPDVVDQHDLARVCTARDYQWPAWAGPRKRTANWKAWPLHGLRLVVPMVDLDTNVRNLRFRRTFEGDDPRVKPSAKSGGKWPPKSLSRMRVKNLVMACPTARELLRAKRWPSERPKDRRIVVVTEGEMDYLSAVCRCRKGDWPPAVIGLFSGSWDDAIANRIPDGTKVMVAVDPDAAGDGYARTVVKTLLTRDVLVARWRAA